MYRLILTICLILLLFGGAFAGTIKVPADYATIQAGINAAVIGDTVLVAEGTYYENINFKGKSITVASHFLMDSDTTHINNTVINGSQPSHPDSGSVVSFVSGEDTTSTLTGFTITQGSGTETSFWWEGVQYFPRSGGGIFCDNSGARIVKNKIFDNTVQSPDKEVSGGGFDASFYDSTAYVILEDNQILHNTVTADVEMAWGGGVNIVCNGRLVNNIISFNTVVHNVPTYHSGAGGLGCGYEGSHSNIIVESNKITHNSVFSYSNDTDVPTAFGGGVCILGIDGRFTKNEVSHNELWVNSDKFGSGAGIVIQLVPESFIIEGNIIRENAVMRGGCYGGGFCIWATASISLINNIIDGNSASKGGGFQIGVNSTVELINNTIINNQAAVSGGGIHLTNSSKVYLMNTIMWANQAPTNAGIQIIAGTVQGVYSDIQGGWTGAGNINVDPLFADSLFHLSDGSPCIGKGIASIEIGGMMCYCPETDIAGHSRPDPSGSNPDIGAWESSLPNPIDEVLELSLTEIPRFYSLAQNYPNPFNPSTTIEFALPKPAFVMLKVYNMLGEQVATLIAEKRSAGIHKLNWGARGLASGVYLYRLEAGDFVQAKKLILIR